MKFDIGDRVVITLVGNLYFGEEGVVYGFQTSVKGNYPYLVRLKNRSTPNEHGTVGANDNTIEHFEIYHSPLHKALR